MTCICDARHLSENFKTHPFECDEYSRKERDRQFKERIAWLEQDHQCSGPGYSHKAHGKCTGYSTDRT